MTSNPAELGDDAFAMFKRGHGDDQEGCAIGLAVCRKIVEAHGGGIVAARRRWRYENQLRLARFVTAHASAGEM
jgi:K+-sensing histidine kinase KdpD